MIPDKSIRPFLACMFSVGLCLAYAISRHELPDWWRSHGGGIPYVVFWITLWLTIVPDRRRLIQICIGCVFITCGLEFLQLWTGPEWLQSFRQTRFGAAWLGSGFDWHDIPPYVLGGFAGWLSGHLLVEPSVE